MNRFDACWRWLRRGEASAWYPNLRQFRQAEPGAWDDVVARIRAALAAEIQIKAAALAPLGSV